MAAYLSFLTIFFPEDVVEDLALELVVFLAALELLVVFLAVEVVFLAVEDVFLAVEDVFLAVEVVFLDDEEVFLLASSASESPNKLVAAERIPPRPPDELDELELEVFPPPSSDPTRPPKRSDEPEDELDELSVSIEPTRLPSRLPELADELAGLLLFSNLLAAAETSTGASIERMLCAELLLTPDDLARDDTVEFCELPRIVARRSLLLSVSTLLRNDTRSSVSSPLRFSIA